MQEIKIVRKQVKRFLVSHLILGGVAREHDSVNASVDGLRIPLSPLSMNSTLSSTSVGGGEAT